MAIELQSGCPMTQLAAPEMKNHLSILGSIGAGARFSFWGTGCSCSGLTRLADCFTVRFVLVDLLAGYVKIEYHNTYVEIPPGCVFPVMSLSQASAHSRTTSMAYLVGLA